MPRHHILISGTGRAGTTFLVQLLTRLGLPTGFNVGDFSAERFQKGPRAGLERDIRDHNAPYVVKDPCFCDFAGEVFADPEIIIDYLIVPVRDHQAAAESRRHVVKEYLDAGRWRRKLKYWLRPFEVEGGLWHTRSSEAGKQEGIILNQLYTLILEAANSLTPVILLKFPRIVKDGAYLYEKLKPVLGGLSEADFMKAFHETANPELVHNFNAKDQYMNPPNLLGS